MLCSNPEDFGILGTDKDPIFDSLKSIAKLPSSPPKKGDRLDDSAVQIVGSPATGEGKVQEEDLGGKSPATGEAENLGEKPLAACAGE